MISSPDASPNIRPEQPWDLLFTHASIAAMTGGSYTITAPGALAVSGSAIAWAGPMADLPRGAEQLAGRVIDCRGKWLLPGFVDCHTHMVWAGSRANEFELRLKGATYAEISAAGGGIFSTVKATREADEQTLFASAADRARHFLKQGVTCLEIKSGYGLDPDNELKMLSVIGRLDRECPQDIHATFLGAHALPPEFSSDGPAYVDRVIREMLPRVKAQGIATAVDVFCEHIAFSREQTEALFRAARDQGLQVKLHAEQLSDSGGAALAASFNALSCDHLEYLSPEGADAMARNGVTAVLLPGAFHYLKETQKPPLDLLRRQGIPMALATDLNPGTSPVFSMTQILNLGCLLLGMTCEEAIAGATLNGARALGLAAAKGSLDAGKDADITLWDMEAPADLCYLSGRLAPEMVVVSGKIAYTNPEYK